MIASADLIVTLQFANRYIESQYLLTVLHELLVFCGMATPATGVSQHPLGRHEHMEIVSLAIADVDQLQDQLNLLPQRSVNATTTENAYLEWRSALQDSLVNPESKLNQVCVCHEGTARPGADLFTRAAVVSCRLACARPSSRAY